MNTEKIKIQWDSPDNIERDAIINFGKKAYKNKRNTILLVCIFIMLGFIHIPFAVASTGSKYNINNTDDLKDAIICCVIFITIDIIICITINYFYIKKLHSINNTKYVISYGIVRDRHSDRNHYYTTVQMSDNNNRELIVNSDLYHNIGLGSLLIVIKYFDHDGFYDQYDMILNPNTIAENH